MRNRHRGSNIGLLLLASQVFQLGIDNIPPVTLATLGLNVYLFLFPVKPLLQVDIINYYIPYHNKNLTIASECIKFPSH